MKLKFWERKVKSSPIKFIGLVPPGAVGWAYVCTEEQIRNGSYLNICTVWGHDYGGLNEMTALETARLIAAALNNYKGE